MVIHKGEGCTMGHAMARPLRLVHRARGICRDCKRCIKATAPALIARPHQSTVLCKEIAFGNYGEISRTLRLPLGWHGLILPKMDKPEPYQSQATFSYVVVVPRSICFHAFPCIESGARFQFPAFQWKEAATATTAENQSR